MDALYYNQYHNDILIYKTSIEVQIPLGDMNVASLGRIKLVLSTACKHPEVRTYTTTPKT